MSEPRTHTPSTSSKSPQSRKRSAKAAPPQAIPKPASDQASAINLSVMNREAMIATAAYFRAQKRDFAAGHELEDWLAAESEVDAVLHTGNGSP